MAKTIKLKEFEVKEKRCGNCPLKGGDLKTTIGYGNHKSGTMIIGEGPGHMETKWNTGKPFVGPSGGILNWALVKSGFIEDADDRADKCYVTNATKCYPAYGKMRPNINRESIPLDPHMVRTCVKGHLSKEIKGVKPKFVLLLGKSALSAFTGNYQVSIEKERGFWKQTTIDGQVCWYLATLHPAHVFRNGDKTSTFYRDIETFVNMVQSGKEPNPQLGKHYQTVTKFPVAKALFKKLKKKKRLAVDTETRNARNYDEEWHELGISWCWKTGHAAYVPLKKEGGDNYWPPKQDRLIRKWSKQVLENPAIKKDGQNIKYDVNVFKLIGIDIKGIDWDTMQGHHLFDETTFTNLTFLTSWYRLGFPKYEDDIKEFVGKYKSSRGTTESDYATVPVPIMGKYACADVDAVWRIRRIQKKKADKRIRNLYYNVSVEMSKSAAEMEYHGALIDIARIKDLEKEYDKEIAKVNTKLSKLVKMDHFNVNSPIHMKHVLYGEDKGCLNLLNKKKLKGKIKKTKKGNWSTDKDTFVQIERNVKTPRVLKVLEMIRTVRKMRKMKSTYLTGFKKIVDPNNRVHTSYLTTGTVTGRYASMDPNLQNIPRDPIFRSLFIAGPGRKMIPSDYSQIEARLVAWLAKEIDYIKQFADPKFDPHTYNSALVREKPMEEVTKEERSYDKAVTFGMTYGRSNRSIAETYDLTLEFVDDFVFKYFEKLSKIKEWRDKQEKISSTQRPDGTYYLQSKTGRRRHFHAYEWIFSEEFAVTRKEENRVSGHPPNRPTFGEILLRGTMERQSINFPIQSYASDLLSMATAKVRKKIKAEKLDAFLVLTVHDMIAIDGSDNDINRAAEILEEEMPFVKKDKKRKLKLAFPVDYEITDHWVQ